jgi:aspartate aminotransferase
MVKKLNEIEGIYCPLPGGAFYVWPEVSGLCRRLGLNGSDELQQKLLYEAGVAVLSDKHFVPAGIKLEGEHLRLAYTLSSTEIEEVIEQIKDYIRQGPIS